MEYFIQGMTTKYMDFSGRARRKEYWMIMLFVFITSFIGGFVLGFISGLTQIDWISSIGLPLIQLIFFFPCLSAAIRRLHDSNKSGWAVLVAFIPIIGFFALIYLMILPGTEGPNKYGADPITGEAKASSSNADFI